jgi:hypothetical protein
MRLRHGAVSLALATSCRAPSASVNDAPPRHPPVVHDGDAVFFVGNSFLGWEGRNLPEQVAALGAGASPPLRISVGSDIVFGEAPLGDFLEHAAVQEALVSGSYDVFVLQGYELEPVDGKEAFFAAVREFDRRIRAAGARTVLFMTWDFPWRPFIADVAASYDAIGRELGVPVIPTGLVYEDARRQPPAGRRDWWLTADTDHPAGDLHPNADGAAVNAYVTFAVLTGRDPQGAELPGPGISSDPRWRRYLSDLAWARAAPRIVHTQPAAAP